MSDELELIESQIAKAKDKGDHRSLQVLYLKREQAQEREFKASLRRRAKLSGAKP